MTDVPVYVVANFTIDDPEVYRPYVEQFFPLLERHGGEFFTFDDQSETVEGSAPLEGRVALFRFPNEEAARSWYNDPEYQAISEHRRAGSSLRFLTFVHGTPSRG